MATNDAIDASTRAATKTAITMTAGGLGAAAGSSVAHTAGVVLTGKTAGTVLGPLL